MENKELYTYIVQSLDILNKSLTISEQNTVKLFSYLHNEQTNIIRNINENYINKIDFEKNNKSIEDLENCILKLDNTIKKLESKVNKLESQIKNNDSNIIETPVIIQEDISFKPLKVIQKYYNFSIIYIKQLYNKVYRYIFKKKIQKELEEQEKAYQEKLAEKRKQEEIERKNRIKEILNKPKMKK